MKKVLSYGGGLDSFAMLLTAIARGEKPDVCAFIDVGDGSRERDGIEPGEWPGTYRHLREIVIPICEREGIAFVWIDSVSYPVRDATSLFSWLRARNQIPISGPQRICTVIAKVERFEKWLSTSYPGEEVEVWIGFEAGEEKRAEKDPNAGSKREPKPGEAVRRNRFPLMEQGLCRCRCEELVRRLGLPVPRKSACVFCPYGTKGDWQTFARELPEVFAQTVKLEADKPPTAKNNVKLSIMGYRAIKDKNGVKTGYKAPPLPVYIEGVYRPKTIPCEVCGAAQRATKATGCDWVGEAA